MSLEALKGQTDDLGESGVSGSLIQTYLKPILGFLLSKNMPLMMASLHLVQCIIHQGTLYVIG